MEEKQEEHIKEDNYFPKKNLPKKAHGNAAESDFLRLMERAQSRKKWLATGAIALVVVLVAGSAAWRFSALKKNEKAEPEIDVAVEIPKNSDHVFVNDVEGVIEQKKEAPASDNRSAQSGVAAASENYQLRDIAFGGSASLLAGDNDNLPLEIYDVRSEMLTTKKGDESKVLITWKTSKLAKSEVVYAKNGNGGERRLNEGGYGFAHAVVLSKLESSTRYTFAIKSADRWANKAESDQFSVYTGTKQASIIEIISKEFEGMFGWAVKK